MRLFSLAIFALLALVFSACADKTPKIERIKIDEKDLKLVLVKSQNIKFYDFGTLEFEPNLRLNIFKLGNFLGSFIITKSEICYQNAKDFNDCAPKWAANKSFFGKVSYDSLMEEILRKEDIFEGRGKRLEAGGVVIQEFSFGDEKIYYERGEGKIYFKNLTNGVMLSIEDYKK